MTEQKRESSLERDGRDGGTGRKRLNLKGEFALALLPTVTVLVVFAFVQALGDRHLLFASLASSAFLIYLDPRHRANSVRTLVIAQTSAAVLGSLMFVVFGGGGLAAGGCAMVAAILVMILLDAMHPPAVSTALGFGFSAEQESHLLLFVLIIGVLVLLVVLQKFAVSVLERIERRGDG